METVIKEREQFAGLMGLTQVRKQYRAGQIIQLLWGDDDCWHIDLYCYEDRPKSMLFVGRADTIEEATEYIRRLVSSN